MRRATAPKGYTLIRFGLIFKIPHALVFLDRDKPAATFLAQTQITFLFGVTNPARYVKLYLKTGALAAVWTKFDWHAITPHIPILKSKDHADKVVCAQQSLVRFSPLQPL